jgi:mannan endo-1,4-beta-mannosidase
MTQLPIILSLTQLLGVATDTITAPVAVVAQATTIRLEADTAKLTGNTLLTATPGFSGTGYAGDFIPEGSKIEWTIPNARAGLYTVQLRYSAPYGDKGYDLVVNGKKSSGTLTATGKKFVAIRSGQIELVSGANTIAIERGWGYFQINSLELEPAKSPVPLRPVPAKLSDPKATVATRTLFADLRRAYGTKTFSGQTEVADTTYLRTTIGRTPAIQASDFIEYSPTRVANGSKPGRKVEETIQAAKSGQIVTMLWHWNAPADLINKTYTDKNGKTVNGIWWRGFYTDATTFDLEQAINTPARRSTNFC